MDLKNGEKILMIVKNNNYIYFILGIYKLLFLFIIIFIYYYFSYYQYILLIIIFFFQVILLIYYYLILKFELQTIFITNFRIIGIKKINIFSYNYFEKQICDIIELKAKTKGFFSNFFGFGKLHIICKNGDLSLNYCPGVIKKTSEIIELIKKY